LKWSPQQQQQQQEQEEQEQEQAMGSDMRLVPDLKVHAISI